jgi:hypothetical protein
VRGSPRPGPTRARRRRRWVRAGPTELGTAVMSAMVHRAGRSARRRRGPRGRLRPARRGAASSPVRAIRRRRRARSRRPWRGRGRSERAGAGPPPPRPGEAGPCARGFLISPAAFAFVTPPAKEPNRPDRSCAAAFGCPSWEVTLGGGLRAPRDVVFRHYPLGDLRFAAAGDRLGERCRHPNALPRRGERHGQALLKRRSAVDRTQNVSVGDEGRDGRLLGRTVDIKGDPSARRPSVWTPLLPLPGPDESLQGPAVGPEQKGRYESREGHQRRQQVRDASTR